jgi:hypothetical protein
MSILYITEFNATGGTSNFTFQAAQETPVAEQTVSIGGGSVQSSTLNNNTTLVRLHTDAICSVKFGANPTALTTSMRLAANQTEYFSVNLSSGFKVAVISNT